VTVAAQVPQITYPAVGAATVFSFPFRVFVDSDLSVTLNGVAASGYTIGGLGNPTGGTVTFASAPTGTLVLERVMPYQRDIDYQTQGDFRASTVNEDFDRAVMLIQQLLQKFKNLEDSTVALTPGM